MADSSHRPSHLAMTGQLNHRPGLPTPPTQPTRPIGRCRVAAICLIIVFVVGNLAFVFVLPRIDLPGWAYQIYVLFVCLSLLLWIVGWCSSWVSSVIKRRTGRGTRNPEPVVRLRNRPRAAPAEINRGQMNTGFVGDLPLSFTEASASFPTVLALRTNNMPRRLPREAVSNPATCEPPPPSYEDVCLATPAEAPSATGEPPPPSYEEVTANNGTQ